MPHSRTQLRVRESVRVARDVNKFGGETLFSDRPIKEEGGTRSLSTSAIERRMNDCRVAVNVLAAITRPARTNVSNYAQERRRAASGNVVDQRVRQASISNRILSEQFARVTPFKRSR